MNLSVNINRLTRSHLTTGPDGKPMRRDALFTELEAAVKPGNDGSQGGKSGPPIPINPSAIDLMTGLDRSNPPDDVIEDLENDKYYRWITYLFLPIQYAALIWACWMFTEPSWAPAMSVVDKVGLALTIGTIAGIGINTAHELGHKKESHERWLAKKPGGVRANPARSSDTILSGSISSSSGPSPRFSTSGRSPVLLRSLSVSAISVIQRRETAVRSDTGSRARASS